MIQFAKAESSGRDDGVGSASRRFSTTDFADNADAFLSVPIRAIRGLFWLPRIWTERCEDELGALAPVDWESAAMEPPNKAVERTAAPLSRDEVEDNRTVPGFGGHRGRAAVAHLGRSACMSCSAERQSLSPDHQGGEFRVPRRSRLFWDADI